MIKFNLLYLKFNLTHVSSRKAYFSLSMFLLQSKKLASSLDTQSHTATVQIPTNSLHPLSYSTICSKIKSPSMQDISCEHNQLRFLLKGGSYTYESLTQPRKGLLKQIKIHKYRTMSKVSLNRSWTTLDPVLSFVGPSSPESLPLSRNLTELKLIFSGNRIPSNSLQKLAIFISRHLTGLRSLRLDFESCSSISHQDFCFIIKEITRNLLHLDRLSVDFTKCTLLSDKSVEYFTRNLTRYFPDIQTLNFVFKGCSLIGDRSVRETLKRLNKRLYNLKNLSIGFGNGPISDKALKYFHQEPRLNFARVKSLVVYFSRCPMISNKGLKALGKGLSENFRALEKLRIIVSPNYSPYLKVDDEGVKKMIHKICKYLGDLKELGIHLWKYYEVTAKIVESLGAEIGKLKSLKILHLDLQGCNPDTIPAMEMLNKKLTEDGINI